MRLVVLASHPVQYLSPLLRELSCKPGVELDVIYGFQPDPGTQGEGFGVSFEWDIPLLDGYRHRVICHENPQRLILLLRAFLQMWRLLRSLQPDVILCTGWHHPVMFAAIPAAVLSGRHRVLRCEANLLRPRSIFAKGFHRIMLTLYHAALPIGVANNEYYRHFGFSPDRLFFSPYCIENARFARQSESADRNALRERWNIPNHAVCFLFCGKLVEKKYPETAVAAMAGVPNAHLLIAGSGELETAIRQEAARLGVQCSFAGFLNQSELPLAYAAADCLVLPSDAGETWGLVVNEAMACGLPAIVSDRVGCRQDLIEEGVTGLSFRFGDIHDLRRAMTQIAKDPGLTRRMGEAARRRVQSYSIQAAAEGVCRAAESLTGKQTPAHISPDATN